MIRRNLTLGPYTYIVDLYKAKTDLSYDTKDTYIMLRKFGISNNLTVDTDVYFINRDDFLDFISTIYDGDGTSSILAFPVNIDYGTKYSNNIYKFNSNYRQETFLAGEDIYNLFNKDGEAIKIPSDVIRMYHPSTTKGLDAIIHLENYINDIHFHYFCRPYDSLEVHSEGEFYENNLYYSEYVEFRIPNIESLFSAKFNYKYNYYDEKLITDTFFTLTSVKFDKDIYNNLLNRIVDRYPFNTYIPERGKIIADIIMEFFTDEEKAKLPDDIYEILTTQEWPTYNIYNADGDIINQYEIKTYDITHNINNVYFEDNLNIISKYYNERRKVLNPYLSTSEKKVYEYVDEKLEMFEELPELQILPLHTLIQPYYVIEQYADDYDYETESGDIIFAKKFTHIRKSIENNYLTYPININIYSYSEINSTLGLYVADNIGGFNSTTFYTECKFQLCSKLGFDKNGVCSIINEFNYPNKTKYELEGNIPLENDPDNETELYPVQRAWCAYNCVTKSEYTDIVADEWDTDYPEGEKINLIGYYIEIATDIQFKHIIYRFNIEKDFIDDFAFNLTGIFDSWNNLQEIIVARVRFIDKYLGIVIDGNFVVITKEWFKYIVNDTETYKCKSLKEHQNNLSEKNMDISEGINFIDKITCIIKKSDEDTSSSLASSSGVSGNSIPKILYKPVFYKVHPVTSITLRSGVSQNIGINLSEYLTKVDTFKISIDGYLFVESARNDMYVIFNIDATLLTNSSGTFDILDTDSEYITSGSWSKY